MGPSPNAVSMLAHRLRRWPNIKTLLGECPMLAGIEKSIDTMSAQRCVGFAGLYRPNGGVGQAVLLPFPVHMVKSAIKLITESSYV